MDYTQMRFKDLLVSDLGSLPPDAHINEELYNLLTLPYTLGSDMNTRLTTHKYHGDSGTYQIGMTLSKGSAEAKLVTDIRVTDGKAEITEYNGEVSMLRVSAPRVAHDRVELKFSDKDYENSQTPFQDYLADISSSAIWMSGIITNPNISVEATAYDNVTKESVGMLYHMIQHMDIQSIPAELRSQQYGEYLRVRFGNGEHAVTVLRPEAKVDGVYVEERYDAIYKPDAETYGTLEIQLESRPRDKKALRKLVTEGKPLVTHTSKSILVDGEMNTMTYAIGVRNIMKQLHEQPVAAEELLDGLSQDGLQL